MNEGALTNTGNSRLWKAIWQAPVWPKVRTFMWRLAKNSIAVRDNLVRRGIQTSPLCHACHSRERREHLFLRCSWAQQLWQCLLGLNVAGRGEEPIERWLTSLAAAPLDRRATQTTHQQHARWSLVMLACCIGSSGRPDASWFLKEDSPIC